ncbi:hypothetical protein [Catellatospora methionotrophica]|uniref:hypothetical protein n=1 Tax=Catellatospora methionotrophica TaxID=121620 RepID=UPI00140D70D4|nr:hypothetical protein [Catellatospora methionotrophica]
MAYYLCWTPVPVPLARLVTVAGSRWSVEEAFQTAKGQVGLDQYQCRGWTAWHRFTLLAMIALAVLTVVAVAERATASSADMIDLTLAETRRLINTTIRKTVPADLAMAWSRCDAGSRPSPSAATTSAATTPLPAHKRYKLPPHQAGCACTLPT